jgi:hypothetical protein
VEVTNEEEQENKDDALNGSENREAITCLKMIKRDLQQSRKNPLNK